MGGRLADFRGDKGEPVTGPPPLPLPLGILAICRLCWMEEPHDADEDEDDDGLRVPAPAGTGDSDGDSDAVGRLSEAPAGQLGSSSWALPRVAGGVSGLSGPSDDCAARSRRDVTKGRFGCSVNAGRGSVEWPAAVTARGARVLAGASSSSSATDDDIHIA